MTTISTNPADSSQLSFEEVLAAVQRGDVAAQKKAVEYVLPQVVLAIRARFQSEPAFDPDDVNQSAFRTILRRGWEFHKNEERIDPTTWGELAGLCIRFAYNKARTALKQGTRQKTHVLEGEPSDHAPSLPDDNAAHREMLEHVRSAVEGVHERLDAKEREILRGKFDGQSSSQIQRELAARGLYLTQSGVDKRWKRNIVPKLQNLLNEDLLG